MRQLNDDNRIYDAFLSIDEIMAIKFPNEVQVDHVKLSRIMSRSVTKKTCPLVQKY